MDPGATPEQLIGALIEKLFMERTRMQARNTADILGSGHHVDR